MRRIALLAFFLGMSTGPWSASHAARLPDWAKPIADAAPEIPAEAPRNPSRILFREDRLTVTLAGTFRVRRRVATQALTSRAAEDAGVGLFAFSDGAKVARPRAWHLPPGEKAERHHEQPVDLTLDEAFLTDSRTRLVSLQGVKKGSIVFFEFEAEEVPFVLAYADLFHEPSPTDLARFEVETPPGWSVRHAWLRKPGLEPRIEGNVRTWEMRDLPWREPEPMGDPPDAGAPMLVLAVSPPAEAKVSPRALSDWTAFSRWFEGIAKGRDAVTPEVETAAKAALAGAGSDFFQQVHAEATYVRDRVRYIAKEVGIGGFQPRPAQQVARDLYGDCKDKGTLFRALLAVRGHPSYPILIHATRPATVSDDVPHPGAFNHFVVGVVVPDGASVPPRFESAVMDAGDLGRLLVVDTTAEFVAPGDLPYELSGKRAMVLAGDRGRLVTLPAANPAAHRVERRLDVRVEEDRSLALKLETRFFGGAGTWVREAYRTSSVDHRKETERELLRLWPDAAIQGYDTEIETPEGAFVEIVSLHVPPGVARDHTEPMSLFPLAGGDLERVPLGKRQGAVDYGYPRLVRNETSFHEFPDTAELPPPEETKGAGWSVTTRFAREGRTLRATREILVSKARFEPEEFPELKKLWAASGKSLLVPW